MDEYALVVDTVGADPHDPGYDRYLIAMPTKESSWDCGARRHPLVHFEGGDYVSRAEAHSVKELKAKLRAMLKACDQKPRRLTVEAVKLVLEK